MMSPLQPNDPNQALLRLKQQETFARAALKDIVQPVQKCIPQTKIVEKNYTCDQLEAIMIDRCQLQDQNPYKYEGTSLQML